MFLSSNVQYTEPITDPWFHAQHPWTATWEGNALFEVTLYNRETPTSVLGCAEEVELCNRDPSSEGKCTRLMVEGYPAVGGSGDTPGNITELLKLNKRQSAVAYRLQDASYRSSLDSILVNTGAQSLLAFQAVASQSEASFSTGLPSDQWTKEIENWFATQLTVIQLYSKCMMWEQQSSAKAC